jgi:hypothetical protein
VAAAVTVAVAMTVRFMMLTRIDCDEATTSTTTTTTAG